ncbi:NADH dehydrogenase [ubiquinone] 1 alpha subcomplex assembly factor 4-like [Saccoglossus kowalevskii]|uniref:NADH dehydrogenase [ubiquinone] 1 alpha subcomplex assembly factor 4-like n=1 Tax=Saccoglossus kowalevskii TaxID=10224 RepID=A0ABM0GVX2_SACKO|nr:PREDICTED: NADH dehydrogenase [ubiquinone] 1 alpha subcomplex assembly factor 4-like [Saccoglossus kowalevskii]
MGARIARTFRNINIENKAQKYIDKDIPRPAPRHSTTVEKIDTFVKSNPHIAEEVKTKHVKLDEFLKKVRVESTEGAVKKLESVDSTARPMNERKLPMDTKKVDLMSAFDAPREIPEGKLSVVMALELLSKHKRSPEKWPAERLAEDFNMDLETTKHIIQYFKVFKVHTIGPSEDMVKGIRA